MREQAAVARPLSSPALVVHVIQVGVGASFLVLAVRTVSSIDDAIAHAVDVRVLRTQGLETESPLAFAALHRESGGIDGLVSLEVSPALAHDTEGTIHEAERLWGAVVVATDRPAPLAVGTEERLERFAELVALARLGHTSAWVSRLTENPMGRLIANHARAVGMDISHAVTNKYDGVGKQDRIGLNFTEVGHSKRASVTLYDRGHSATAGMQPGEERIYHQRGDATAQNPKTGQAVKAAGLDAEPLGRPPDQDPRHAMPRHQNRGRALHPRSPQRGADRKDTQPAAAHRAVNHRAVSSSAALFAT